MKDKAHGANLVNKIIDSDVTQQDFASKDAIDLLDDKRLKELIERNINY